MLHLPAFDLYVDPTAYLAAFGVLPWSNYDKPVAAGGRRPLPPRRARRCCAPTTISSRSRRMPRSRMTAISLARRRSMRPARWRAPSRLDRARSRRGAGDQAAQFFDGPGTGKWLDPVRNDAANDVSLKSKFAMADTIDLAAGEALVPPPGLRFLARPGTMLMGTHDTPRTLLTRAMPAARSRRYQVPAGFKPQRLPHDRAFETAIAAYSARYAFRDGTLTVRPGVRRTAPAAGLHARAEPRDGRPAVAHPARLRLGGVVRPAL